MVTSLKAAVHWLIERSCMQMKSLVSQKGKQTKSFLFLLRLAVSSAFRKILRSWKSFTARKVSSFYLRIRSLYNDIYTLKKTAKETLIEQRSIHSVSLSRTAVSFPVLQFSRTPPFQVILSQLLLLFASVILLYAFLIFGCLEQVHRHYLPIATADE